MSEPLKKYWVCDSPDGTDLYSTDPGGRTLEVYLAADVEPVLQDVRTTLLNLVEYWNGNHNERAMVDALEHMERESMRLLARLGGSR